LKDVKNSLLLQLPHFPKLHFSRGHFLAKLVACALFGFPKDSFHCRGLSHADVQVIRLLRPGVFGIMMMMMVVLQ
jgi:hypothetical protein